VPLQKKGGTWVAQREIGTKKPTSDSAVFLKARVTGGGEGADSLLEPSLARRPRTGEISLAYGIEEYFIPEDSGKRLPSGEAIAKVAIDKEGNAVIKQIYINDKQWP